MDREASHLRSRRIPYQLASPRTLQGISTTVPRILKLATGNWVLATETSPPTRPLHPAGNLASRKPGLPANPPSPRRSHPTNARRRRATRRHRRHPPRLRPRRPARRAIHPLLERRPPRRPRSIVPLQPKRNATANPALPVHAATNAGVAVRRDHPVDPRR